MSLANLERVCDQFRRRLKTLSVKAGLARIVLLLVTVTAVMLLLDWWARLAWPGRLLGLLGLLVGVVVTFIWTLYRPLKQRWTNEQILSYVDSTAPSGGRGMLLDLYELLHKEQVQELDSPIGQELAEQAVQELEPAVKQIKVAGSFHTKKASNWIAAATVALLVFLGVGVGLYAITGDNYIGVGMKRLFLLSSQRWPHQTHIHLDNLPEPGYRVPQRGDLTIEGHVRGQVPPSVLVEYRSDDDTDWHRTRAPVADDGRFEHTFTDVRREFVFILEGGDYRTPRYQVAISPRPFIEHVVASYEAVPYARIPSRTAEDGRVRGLEGQRVTLRFRSSMDLEEAQFIQRVDGEPTETTRWTFTDANRRTFEKKLVLEDSGSYQIVLKDVFGVGQERPEIYAIMVHPDYPPEVQITAPGENLEQTMSARIDVAFRATDDFNLESIQVMYALDGSDPVPLPPEITGPISTGGRMQEHDFRWDLTRTMDPRDPDLQDPLPDSGTLSYFVRVSDGREGREPVDSARYSINIVTPAEFHRRVFERASTRLLNQARIAEGHQLQAWVDALGWLEAMDDDELDMSGPDHPGHVENRLWASMAANQDAVLRDVRELTRALDMLISQYERNDMQRAFMSGRVDNIRDYIRELEFRVERAADGIEAAKPVTDADAQPDSLYDRRKGRLGDIDHATGFIRDQKMAALMVQRLLRRLYDWQDLQTATVQATNIEIMLREVMEANHETSPKYIGKSILDLTYEEQEELITLARRQQTVADAEGQLESQLDYMIERAEFQERPAILAPLRTVFELLRDNRVHDMLEEAARSIENNQGTQVIGHLESSLHWIRAVRGALVRAGRDVDDEGPTSIDIAMDVDVERSLDPQRFRDVMAERRAEEEDEDEDEPEIITDRTPLVVDRIDPREFFESLGEGEEALTEAIRFAIERQEDVLARTRFLGGTDRRDSDAVPLTDEDLPRFRRLSQGALLERQDMTLDTIDVALERAEGDDAEMIVVFLELSKEELGQSRQLIAQEAPNYSVCTQHLQDGTIRLLQTTVADYMPSRQAVLDAVAENRRSAETEGDADEDDRGLVKRAGHDDRGQPYVLRGENLDLAEAMMNDILTAFIYQDHNARTVKRLAETAPADDLQQQFETENRDRASGLQRDVTQRIVRVAERFEQVQSEEVKMQRLTRRGGTVMVDDEAPRRIEETSVGEIIALRPDDGNPEDLGIGALDREGDRDANRALVRRLEDQSRTFSQTIRSFRGLFPTVVRIPRRIREEEEGPPPLSEEDWEQMTAPDTIRTHLGAHADPLLAEHLREIMIKQLGEEDGLSFERRFEQYERYLPLLRAYYSSFVTPDAEIEQERSVEEETEEPAIPEEVPE